MYPRTITELIVEDWAKGASAEETKAHLENRLGIHLCLSTIYKHRHSLTAQTLIDELIRQQERAILKSDTENPELAMRYRNELLKILLPQRMEINEKIEEIKLIWQPSNSQSTTNPTQDNTAFITIPPDSDSSPADDDGAKPSAEPTKPSKNQYNQDLTASASA